MSDHTVSSYAAHRLEKLRGEAKLSDETIFMPPEAMANDPLGPAVIEKSFQKAVDPDKVRDEGKDDEADDADDAKREGFKSKKSSSEEKPMAEKEFPDKKDDKEEEKSVSKKEVDMDDDEEDEDDSEEEKERLKRKKKKGKKAVEDDKEDVKKTGNPEEEGAKAAASGTITPGDPMAPPQVFVPTSNVTVSSEHVTPMGKSVEPDLLKSPLWVGINKQLESMQDTLGKKVDSLQKSVDDRLKNIKTDMEKIEKFYSQSFYKAAAEETGPEGLKMESFSKQLERGEIRFRNK